MLKQPERGAEEVVDGYVDGMLHGVDKGHAEAVVVALQPQPVVDGHHGVALVRQPFIPLPLVRVVAFAFDEAAAKDEQNGRFLPSVDARPAALGRAIDVEIEAACVAVGKLESARWGKHPLLCRARKRHSQKDNNKGYFFHNGCKDRVSQEKNQIYLCFSEATPI